MTEEPAADLTGRRLGHYKIDGVLGRGGMSVMYRATDTRLGRKVALKVMGEHITGDAEFRERFVDEARNTSAIDHANIVPLYDFGEVDGMLYIAMRLVDGSDLASLIKDGPISPKRALELLSRVADLRGAGAPAWRAGRRPHRPLRADVHAVRLPDRPAAVPGAGAGGHPGA